MHVSKYIALLSLLICTLVAHCLPIAIQRSSFPSTASASSSYNASDALLAWQYSKTAYCEVTDILAWNCSACGNATSGFVPFWSMEMSNDVQVFVGYDAIHDIAVISFRGSKTLTNWLLNLEFAHTDSPFSECLNCYVHRGFLDDYNSVAVQVFVAVNQIREKYGVKRVLITGHSLGGVLATLAAIDLKLHDSFENVSVITFGEPRLGNAQFADPLCLLYHLSCDCFFLILTIPHTLTGLPIFQISCCQSIGDLSTTTILSHMCRLKALGSGTTAMRCGTTTGRTLHAVLKRILAAATAFPSMI
jgi:hypothetical protein